MEKGATLNNYSMPSAILTNVNWPTNPVKPQLRQGANGGHQLGAGPDLELLLLPAGHLFGLVVLYRALVGTY